MRAEISAKASAGELKSIPNAESHSQQLGVTAKRRRWDQATPQMAPTPSDLPTPMLGMPSPAPSSAPKLKLAWAGAEAATPAVARWDETPVHIARGSETPGATPSTRMWDATPGHQTPGIGTAATPRRNRWDETPKGKLKTFSIQ